MADADQVLELFPRSGQRRRLKNLYLDQMADLPKDGLPFIYSNYIASLDGRIALPAEDRHSHQVPPAIANDRDWRLFQELAAQADLLITSGRYFRQAADAETQSELPVGQARDFDDLRAWRLAQGLKPQPDIAVFSASLDIPLETLEHYRGRQLLLITGKQADRDKIAELTGAGQMQLIQCGDGGGVDATDLKQQLRRYAYRRVYAIAGPSVLHTLASGNALDRLYHTTAHCLLGGKTFDTFVWGEQLQPAFALPLRAMYLDTEAPPGCGQTMAVYGR